MLGMELLVGCFSERPGLAVGIGEVGYGLGHILGAPMMQMLLRSFRTVTSIYMSAMLFVACNMLPAVLTRWPIPAKGEGSGENSGHERAALIEDIAHKVDEEQSLRVMMRQRTFWLFAIVVATSGASYGFFPYFFKLGSIFGQPSHLVTTYFQVIGSVSIAACLLSCAVMDYAKIGTGFWGMGSKNVMMFFLALQAMCFWLLIRFSESGHYFGFVCTLLVLSISAVTLTGSSVVLARDLFGNTNGCIVFGVAGGLGLGLGEASSAWLMTASERMASHVGGSESPIDFITFYAIGLIWSLVGLFCLIMTRKQALVPGILV